MESFTKAAQTGSLYIENGVSNCYVFKSRLQEYAQKASIPSPVYETVKEGPPHEPNFRSSVTVNGIRYDSLPGFFNRKAAEQSAAEVALLELVKSGNVDECIPHPVHETGLCKNLLQEYAQKMNFPIPSYICTPDNLSGQPIFTCTVEIGGIQYIGAGAKTKKEAEIKAARTALLAIQTSCGETGVNLESGSPLTVLPVKRKGKESNARSEAEKTLKAKNENNFKKRPPRRRFPRGKGSIFGEHDHGITNPGDVGGVQVGGPGMLGMDANMVSQAAMVALTGVPGLQGVMVSNQLGSVEGISQMGHAIEGGATNGAAFHLNVERERVEQVHELGVVQEGYQPMAFGHVGGYSQAAPAQGSYNQAATAQGSWGTGSGQVIPNDSGTQSGALGGYSQAAPTQSCYSHAAPAQGSWGMGSGQVASNGSGNQSVGAVGGYSQAALAQGSYSQAAPLQGSWGTGYGHVEPNGSGNQGIGAVGDYCQVAPSQCSWGTGYGLVEPNGSGNQGVGAVGDYSQAAPAQGSYSQSAPAQGSWGTGYGQVATGWGVPVGPPRGADMGSLQGNVYSQQHQ